MPFNIRTATVEELIERAEYLENFPAASPGYRNDLLGEAASLRKLAAHRRAGALAVNYVEQQAAQ